MRWHGAKRAEIESGTVSAGAGSTAATHTAEFDLVVTEAGDGVFVFTGPDGRSPQLDRLEIVPSEIDITEYTITATAGAGGTISDEGAVSVEEGQSKTYTITADEGYEIADVLVNGESVGAVSSYTFENVNADATIEARFVFSHGNNCILTCSCSRQEQTQRCWKRNMSQRSSMIRAMTAGWPCKVTEAEWASNGKFVDALNQGDVIKYHYRAEDAGTYHVVCDSPQRLQYQCAAWSEESGKIEAEQCLQCERTAI